MLQNTQIAQEEIVKFQPKGLLTIPKKFRQKLGFGEKSLARIKIEKGKLTIEPIRTLSYPVRTYTEMEVQEFLALDKEETRELKKKDRKRQS